MMKFVRHKFYAANFILVAYVILCGSSIAPNFAQNHVFVLEGCTSSLSITNSYDIERVLYKVCDVMLNVHVPFKEAAEYEISLSEEHPTVLGQKLMITI